MTDDDRPQVPLPCVVVLVGPSGSGKSTWAAAHFSPDEIVASDRLRAVVGRGEDDLEATDDAFALLDRILEQRSRRRLTTIVDTLGLDALRRSPDREVAAAHGLPCVAVGFDVSAAECRARNRERAHRVPAAALSHQLKAWAAAREQLDEEGFDLVLRPTSVRLVPERLKASAPLAVVQRERPSGLRFGLQIPSFEWPGGPGALAERLRAVAEAAETAGFESIWVMDHVRQIPQIGRDWDAMPESYTTLAWLAALTTTVRLGTMVTAITYRNIAHLGKIVATLDVLSGGRAVCGLGAAWYEREHKAYGWAFPPLSERYALLEDALQLLPLLWGPGAPSFEGRVLRVPEAICYPRPLAGRVPLLVGGGGERRTLRLVARYADACNLLGEAPVVRHKLDVLRRHCLAVDRDFNDIEVTHLSTTLVAPDRASLGGLVDRLRPRGVGADQFAARVNAGTVDDQIGRFRELADAGVSLAVVSLPDLGTTDAIDRFAPVITAFPARPARP